MLTTVKGTYNNGQVMLEEAPETNGPVEVLVTFTREIEPAKQNAKRLFGFAKGKITFMAVDFDAPLEDLKEYM
ncbi:MAG TPA: hypothetical protein VG738_09050 [Chitinophagaceae bacterium]|nr:hypothetical protein [Chitinophagaceae bacterium]